MTDSSIRCEACSGTGRLNLTKGDQLECWQCLGVGRIEIREYRVSARVRTVFIPGQRPFKVVDLPQRSLISDSIIRRD